MKKLVVLFFMGAFFTSCVAVKEYEKAQLNSEDMVLSARFIVKHETNMHIYREGAAGANGGKIGGGCGCN